MTYQIRNTDYVINAAMISEVFISGDRNDHGFTVYVVLGQKKLPVFSSNDIKACKREMADIIWAMETIAMPDSWTAAAVKTPKKTGKKAAAAADESAAEEAASATEYAAAAEPADGEADVAAERAAAAAGAKKGTGKKAAGRKKVGKKVGKELAELATA